MRIMTPEIIILDRIYIAVPVNNVRRLPPCMRLSTFARTTALTYVNTTLRRSLPLLICIDGSSSNKTGAPVTRRPLRKTNPVNREPPRLVRSDGLRYLNRIVRQRILRVLQVRNHVV